MSTIIGDEACPRCRENGRDSSGNHLIIYSNGNKFCNRCGYKENNNNKQKVKLNMTLEEVLEFPILELADREIPRATAEKFGVRVELDAVSGVPVKHYYPYFKNSELVGYKVRNIADKTFFSVGSIKGVDPFGFHLIGEGGKLLVITEGECDAMAASQLFKNVGKNYRVISLPNGASSSGLQSSLEVLSKFENIVLCFDQDEPGKKAVDKVSPLFKPGQVKVMSFSEKDANEMLRKGKTKEFMQSLANASAKRPDGIISGADTWQKLQDRPEVKSIAYPQDWNEMNGKTYGVRLGELDTWTSGSGMGKTQVLRELELHLLDTTEDGIGVIALEEQLEDSVEALMALRMNKRYQLPDIRETITDEEKYEAWLSTSGTNRIHYYDHFGSVDDESLISKIRYMARGLGCKYIFLDHLSIVVSEFADQGGERERIDTIMTRLKNLTQELGIWLGLVVHLRKVGGGTSFEEGAVPSLDDLRGSGSIKQLSNSVYALSRNQQHPDDEVRNTSTMHVLKCRFTGRTGVADNLFFDDTTGRMTVAEGFEEEEDNNEF